MAINRKASHNCKRQRMEGMNMLKLLSFDRVPLSAPCHDEVPAQFSANAENMNVHQIRKGVIAFIEEMFVQFRAANNLAPVQREILEDGIFARCERDGLSGAGDGASPGINDDVPKGKV